ncbi:polysaccharide biosynthesis protein [Enterocloster clostridioformis]|nr:nucleoside-diphosphate sugar epimerase/dehydratase [Enterocloster clostridioformis]NSJ55771.1 polysaccharide biosynthesis protein [Enterocloster clostridioformis]
MCMVWICACFALGLRFDLSLSSVPVEYAGEMWKYGILQMAVVSLVFYAGRLYAIMWGVSGVREMMQVLLACLVAALAQSVGILLFHTRMPRSYYVLWFVLMAGAAISGRVSFQVLEKITDRINRFLEKNIPPRVMIIGAGKAGTLILKEMKASEKVHGYPVCMIDDDKDKQGRVIDGVSIMGSRRDIARLVREKGIDEIYVAIPTAPPEDIRDILKICQGTGCQVKILPGVYQLMNGEVTISRLRKVEIEDLLGREPVNVNLDEIMGYVKGKVVLVTGGGGSIGSELCRQLAGHKVKQLIIFDIYENNAYEIQQELKRKYPRLDLVVLIGSVRNTNRLDYLFRTYRPDIVYHAAAHKHVPLMEDSPNEAIKNNVLGTYKTAGAAIKYKAQRFILISTDKAVNPTNIMGASKRLCEMVIQMSNQKSSTEFVAVRFGNVLGSNGSVIPLFKQQIESGGPVTVTHKDIIRYFMTIPEAVSLVIQAGAYAKGGEIFVLNMGNPVRILDMAENLIRLSGYEPYKDIDICFTGLRPGEKLYEELLMDEEGLQKTVNDRIFIGKPIDMDYDRFERALQRLGEAALSETANVRLLVHELVPEYHYKNMDSDIAAAEAAVSQATGVTSVNPERFALHKKIAMYNLGVK